KQFSENPESLASQVKDQEDMPPALDSGCLRDVTEEYIPTTDVRVSLVFPPPRPMAVSYICVFNAGEWRPIHWARIADGHAVFTRMGREVVYLPAYYDKNHVVAASSPFILNPGFDDKNHIVAAAPPFALDPKGRMIQLGVNAGDLARLSLTSGRPTSSIKTLAASE